MGRRAKTFKEWIPVIFKRTEKKENGCWEYNCRKDKNGYGHVFFGGKENGRNTYTHRIVYKVLKGDIPEGMFVCHTCDNPPCCNPEHLFLGTHIDNMKDMVKKGRQYFTYGEKSGQHKLTTEQVKNIREDKRSLSKIAADYGVVKSTISAIKNKKSRIYA